MPTAAAPTTLTAANETAEEGSPFRSPPHNVEAEKALLGAIFVNNRAYENVSEFLKPQHFALQIHGRIFEAVQRLVERGQIADTVTLRHSFEQDTQLADIGGAKYLSDLADSAVTVINAVEYGRLIRDLHLKRELIGLGGEMVNRAYGGADDTAVIQIEDAEQSLFNLGEKGEYEGGFESFKDSVIKAIKMAEAAHKRDGGLAGVGTGFTDLDKILGGLHPSDLIILAGRPSMGKTALATNIAFNAAADYMDAGGQEGAVVGFFSLEMSSEQLASRILSEQSQISSDRMRKGELSNEEFDVVIHASNKLNQIPIFIDDSPALSVSALRTRARRLRRRHNLGMVVVDYLQLISPGNTSRADGRVQEVSEISRGLKALAKELNVPVLALSQLSRQVEQREHKRPQLSDLRESGSIEQDADVVAFIFREEYYLEREKPIQRGDEKDDRFGERTNRWNEKRAKVAGLAEIIIAKQRHGPVGDIYLMFDGQYTRFANLDRAHGPGG